MTLRAASFTLIAVLGLLIHAFDASAHEVPVEVQLPLFQNIWKLDRNFNPAGSSIVVAVLFQESNVQSMAARAAAFKWVQTTTGVTAVGVVMDRADWTTVLRVVEADVFYVTRMRGADIEAVAAIARSRGIRTMAGVHDYVWQGLNVGIGVRNDRPLIMINLQAALAEGAAYQAQLLKLAEIVKK